MLTLSFVTFFDFLEMDLKPVTGASAQYFCMHMVPFSLLGFFVPTLTVAGWSRSVLRVACAGRRGGRLARLFRFLDLDVLFVRNGDQHQVPDRLQDVDSGV